MALVSVSHASTSRAAAHSCINYDVFLSFRGEDTRDAFTDHLFTTLKQAGIRTFRDDSMERGRLLISELKKAISASAISVIVFSEGYASSKWCLDEALMIVEQHETSSYKHEFIPVFYKVDPSDVRNQSGSFKDAFDGYEDEVNAETDLEKKTRLLEKAGAWRKSLKKVATITGLVYKAGYESNFILSILNVVINKVDNKALHIEENLVGIEDNVVEIERWLQDESPDAAVLLIVGMGGIGKTTIAKIIFNSHFRKYDGSCFLADINKETLNHQTVGLLRLQSQLLSTILKSEKEEIIWNIHEGTNKVTNAISNKRLLLVLDDVATCEQLDALLGLKRFYPGSKVIITTRHKELSTAFKVRPEVHTVKTLSADEASELFSLHAFDQHQPIEPYIVQSELVVDRCKGLPLALKVLGSSLRGGTHVWKDVMRRLEAVIDLEIRRVLEISYMTLKHDSDKELFLHIACFFEGEEENYIVKVLAGCNLYPVEGIKILIDRCLAYVEKGRVKMHQLIRKMGREVVHQESPKKPGERSRLWHHEDCIDVLQDQSGTEKVEGLMLDMREMKEAKPTCSFNANFEIGALEKMKNLMLLQLNHVTFSGECKKLPRKLRLLRWHGCTLKAIPSDISLEKLVVLDMSHSKIRHVWGNFKVIGSLKILNLKYCVELTKTPNFHGLPGLESLILKGCSSLRKVDESIAYLKELVLLDLRDCRNLREFPCLPTSLVSLQMSGCGGALGRVQSLDSVPSLSFLVKMNISNCNLSDSSFPDDWSSFIALQSLLMDGNNVTCLPKCVQTLPRVTWLSVFSCSKLKSVVGLPESLEYFYRIHCPQLCEMEGRYKIRSIDKADRKIIRYLGLQLNAGEGMEVLDGSGTFVSRLLQNIIRCLGFESNAGEGVEVGLKVKHEFGIFNTWVADKQIPSVYMYKERGPQISFQVPWHEDGLRISGFNMCVVLSQSNRYDFIFMEIEVYNKTKDVSWRYSKGYQEFPNKKVGKYGWLSVWRCGNLLEAGDEILISIIQPVQIINKDEPEVEPEVAWVLDEEVEECGIIKLIYEVDEGLVDGETEDVSAFNQISWIDRMDTDISDYVYSVWGSHCFNNNYWPNHCIVTRIQLSTEPRTKWREYFLTDGEGRVYRG